MAPRYGCRGLAASPLRRVRSGSTRLGAAGSGFVSAVRGRGSGCRGGWLSSQGDRRARRIRTGEVPAAAPAAGRLRRAPSTVSAAGRHAHLRAGARRTPRSRTSRRASSGSRSPSGCTSRRGRCSRPASSAAPTCCSSRCSRCCSARSSTATASTGSWCSRPRDARRRSWSRARSTSRIPESALLDLGGPWFWLFSGIILLGAVVENLRNIALSTTVTLLVPVERHANANGLVGTVQGVAFIVTSVFSGLAIGLLGMGWTLAIAIVARPLVALVHLLFIRIPEEQPGRRRREAPAHRPARQRPRRRGRRRGCSPSSSSRPSTTSSAASTWRSWTRTA